MADSVAALPMYDWPELVPALDARWEEVRDRLRAVGIPAPAKLARCNADLPPVPGGIRGADGRLIAPDPATLPGGEFDLPTLWRHPRLLLAQTWWGPLKAGLQEDVQLLLQPDYSAYAGGQGEFYSSAIVMRDGGQGAAPGVAHLPLDRLRGARFAFNSRDSRSGYLSLRHDLEVLGESLGIFPETFETGGHRASIRAVAEGRADVAVIDCRSWHLALRHEPAAPKLTVVGWTAMRLGLPFIISRHTPRPVADMVRAAIAGCFD